MYKIQYSNEAEKDKRKIESCGLAENVKKIRRTIKINPYKRTQGFEKLKGNLKGKYSRRINRQHRFVYDILPNDKGLTDENGGLYDGIVGVLSMWGHYD